MIGEVTSNNSVLSDANLTINSYGAIGSMEYNNPKPKTKKELKAIFDSNNTDLITKGLVSLALYEKNWQWAQNVCLQFLNNDDPKISGLAATCLGHIARIHHKLDKEKVKYALKSKINSPLIAGRVQDALDDIELFT